MISKSHRWQKTAMAAAAAALFSLVSSHAIALSLGRITVQSALGEPLRAEIDVPDITAEEAASLKASVALPEAFRAAGLEYNPAMSGLQASLQRRPDGRAFLRLSSDRAINDPFVDMILEANWASGRIVRDYTMLFDPPGARQAAPGSPTAAQIPAPAIISKAAGPTPAAPPAPALRPAIPAKSVEKASESTTALKSPTTHAEQVKVKSGDTASKIAAATKPAKVSLDQMLVAMLRANPDAFVGGNINRVKSGSIMNLPTAEQAGATSPTEATQIIVAQSKDFNDFRRKLADSAPSTQLAAADRKVSGAVQAKVDDKKPATAAPDKLTLTKGAIQGKATEDQLAKERSAKEAASRAAEISKNIAELSKLGAASSAAAPKLATSAAAAPKPPAVAIAMAVLPPAQAASTSASTPVAAAPAKPASAVASSPIAPPAQTASAAQPPASAIAKRPILAPVPPPPEPSLVDELIESPLIPAGAIGLIALLAGFGFYRLKQRKNAAQTDSAFLESRLQPDSFFGASGGQSVDTNDNPATGSSMAYSPSQLDAADDVDPVAEADVYLAYGRDLQAEEILKEALNANPGRIAIYQKLLEIYAKRRDSKSFETIATQASVLTHRDGADWERICTLGQGIDPGNPLYQHEGQANDLESISASLDFTTDLPQSAAPPQPILPDTASAHDAVDLDLDLDFSLDEDPVSVITEASASPVAIPATPAEPEPALSVIDMDFGFITETPESQNAAEFAEVTEMPELSPPVEAPPVPDVEIDVDVAAENSIDFTLPDLDFSTPERPQPAVDNDDFKLQASTSFGLTQPAPLPAPEPTAPAAPDLGMLEFDLGSLSLDLEEPLAAEPVMETGSQEDPLATKLALAEEFSAIGDDDGARALIEEVIAEASGDMKIKAQRALSNL